jgi:acyl carrier protein
MPPLRGVIHAAGVLDDGVLLEQRWPRCRQVLAPKVDGAWNLHQATLNTPLDFFILYSAGAALLGSPGQSSYAAANAFLDGLAHYRRARGLPAVSINWGAWAEVGMAARQGDETLRRWAEGGITPIRPAGGLRALEELLRRGCAQVAVLQVNWHRLQRHGQPLLSRLVLPQAAVPAAAPAAAGQPTFVAQLNAAAPEDRYALLFRRVTEEVNRVLGLGPQQRTNPRQGFTDLGLDSLMAVELSNRLQGVLERRLPSTLTFEHPTIDALTAFLSAEVLSISQPAPGEPSAQVAQPNTAMKTEVEGLDDDAVEDALLKELKDAGY